MASAERFGYEWKKFHLLLPEYEEQFLKWVTPLMSTDFKNKSILDAGCGIGRNSYWPLKYGAKRIVAFDFDKRTVDVAKKNLGRFKNATVRFGSIYEIPEKNTFDLTHAIGVIQHLANPKLAIEKLIDATKKGGVVLIWILGREGNGWIVNLITPLRVLTSRMPLFLVSKLSFLLAIPVYFWARINLSGHPYFKQISRYSFVHIRSIVFDHLIPKVTHYWTRDEAISLLKNAGLKNIQINHINQNSWTVIGRKD